MLEMRNNPRAWGATGKARPIRIGNSEIPLFGADRRTVVSTLRYGEGAHLYQSEGEWVLSAGAHDGYLGWVRDLIPIEDQKTDKIVCVRSTHAYSEASMKSPPRQVLPMGARLRSHCEDGDFTKTDAGFVFTTHLNAQVDDAAGYAEHLLGTPYLWGGGTDRGIDCSGLTQLAYSMVGKNLPRDSDQQEAVLTAIADDELRRGDLVFWRGHVGIMLDRDRFLHATAWTMQVIVEALETTIARIGEPTSCRRVS